MPYVNKDPYAGKLLNPAMYRALISCFVAMAVICLIGTLGVFHTQNKVVVNDVVTIESIHAINSQALMNNIKGENIRQNLRFFTEQAHVAGSDANNRLAKKILDMHKANGLDNVHYVKYQVLLNYPDYKNPNIMTIFETNGTEVYKTIGISPIIIPEEQNSTDAAHQWVAYSANGMVEGDVVYCHHGRAEDFQKLRKLNIEIKGKIALLRYGFSYRGDKVRLAQDHGAIGAILYSDPAEVAKDGMDIKHIYPSTEFMPHMGVQRGSLMNGDGGDPLSPHYPSKNNFFKSRTLEEVKEAKVIPRIPVLPLSYTDAREILKRLGGKQIPAEWQGGFNFRYKFGPGFGGSAKVRIDVKSNFETREIQNVIGYIHGYDEPDKYIILGNHFDSWAYGSLDPNSGTAVLAEVARAMVQTINETNWRPSRTLVFCSWDAEEYGLIGSTEFVEEFTNILQERAIVYLNVDTIYSNQSLDVRTIPTLYNVAIEASKVVKNPMTSEKRKNRFTLWDTWINTFKDPKYPGIRPLFTIPGGGSDQNSFLNYAGIPVADFNYRNASWSEYPLYHSLYETPFVNEHIFDTNNFAVHRAVGQYWGEIARRFADSAVIPLNVTTLAESFLKEYLPELKKQLGALRQLNTAGNIVKEQFNHLVLETKNFMKECNRFDSRIKYVLKKFEENPHDSRRLNSVNSRLAAIERCYINPRGIPGKDTARHVLFSISPNDNYSARVMGTVYDLIAKLHEAHDEDVIKSLERQLAQQISIVHYSVKCCSDTLLSII
uniref:N-acetylated-alpha-linked acidic dipeptidase 2 n=1 Tax=Rhabditophanes sp. KR3021 TaxID=114890 RepID=A0AC35TSG6_9BILA